MELCARLIQNVILHIVQGSEIDAACRYCTPKIFNAQTKTKSTHIKRQIDRLAGTYACNHTHTFNTDLQSHRHTGKKDVHIYSQTKTNRSNPLSLPAHLPQSRQRREDWSVVTCCSRWLPAASSSCSSLPLVLLPPVEEDTHSPKPSALLEIQDAGHLS